MAFESNLESLSSSCTTCRCRLRPSAPFSSAVGSPRMDTNPRLSSIYNIKHLISFRIGNISGSPTNWKTAFLAFGSSFKEGFVLFDVLVAGGTH